MSRSKLDAMDTRKHELATMNILRNAFIEYFTYPGDLDRANYNFDAYLACYCQILMEDPNISKQETLRWILADLQYKHNLISRHADAGAAIDSDEEPDPRETKFKDYVCGVVFPSLHAFEDHIQGPNHKHIKMSAWRLGMYFLYCHLCKRFVKSTAQLHSNNDRHQSLMSKAPRRMPQDRKWIQFCNGTHEKLTPLIREQLASPEEIIKIFPDFKPLISDDEDPTYDASPH